MSKAKGEQLFRTLRENKIDIAVIQETDIASEESLPTRGEVPAYEIIGAYGTYGQTSYDTII